MSTWEYLHRIEYRRVDGRGVPVHEHTETVEDMGFCLRHNDYTREQWFTVYTRACAEDYLGRVRAAGGRWIVTVYRLHGGERTLLGAVKLVWPLTTRTDA